MNGFNPCSQNVILENMYKDNRTQSEIFFFKAVYCLGRPNSNALSLFILKHFAWVIVFT